MPANLVIRPGKLGDLVAAIPTLRAFKTTCPDEPLHLVTDTGTADLLRHDPHVDRIVPIRWTGRRRRERASWREIYQMLSGTDYKRAAILHDGADGWNFICARLRVPHVAQLGFTVASFLFGHHRIPRRGGRRPSHFSELHLRVAGLLGIESSDSMPKLYVTAAEAERARIEFGDVLSVTPCVVIHPFGVTTRFNFGTEAYKRLAGLVSAMTSVPVFFVGTPQERELLGTVDPRHISCRLLREALPLRTLMAIMGQADLVIGGSSGITHMGAALGVPTIGLFCPSNNEAVLWRPRGPAAECLTVSPGLCPRLARNRFACRNVSFCDISFGIPEERILHAVRSSLNRSARIGRSAHTGT